MTGRLQDRAAIITGAARGIGRATAALFLREGARLGLIDSDGAALQESATALARNTPGTCVFTRTADIASEAQISAAIAGLAKDLGGIDILTNNASARAYGPIADASSESWSTILQVNIGGLASCCRAALP